MVVRSKITTNGFEAYLEKLAQAGANIDAVADDALSAGGDVLLNGMRKRVPKDTRNLENHLARSEPVQDGNFHYVEVGMAKGTDAETARYGNTQEYGSSSMQAQPYIRPTFDEDMPKARAAMRKKFKEAGAL